MGDPVGTLDWWEVLHEPPWDIGWGDRTQGPGRRPAPRPVRLGADHAWFAPPLAPARPAREPAHTAEWWSEEVRRALMQDWTRHRARQYARAWAARHRTPRPPTLRLQATTTCPHCSGEAVHTVETPGYYRVLHEPCRQVFIIHVPRLGAGGGAP